MANYDTDVLVIGGGLAGLCAAISSASNLSRTLIATKTLVGGANTTSVAAGVVSAVTDFKVSGDSVDLHYQDTIKGGCGVNDKILARAMVNDIPKYFNRLLEYGVEFEGGEAPKVRFIPGHSKPRSYFLEGRGPRIQAILRRYAEALGVKFMEKTLITSAVKEGERVAGVIGYKSDSKEVVAIRSNAVILATGGSGELYSRTLMPAGSTGYGTSLGLKAGAEVVDMEFVQFYPTMVYEPGLPQIFIDYSPLLRFGATIVNADGTDIFKKRKVDEPFKLNRDAFSKMMAEEMVGEGGELPIYMDCTKIRREDISNEPPLATAVNDLASRGVPVAGRRFGVTPYAHFMMGGLRTNSSCATNIPGLYAAGEAAGGVQGANRIGGNAFAGCIVFGFRSGMAASMYSSTVDMAAESLFIEPASWLTEAVGFSGDQDALKVKSSIQNIMWDNVGIIRTKEGLQSSLESLNSMRGITLHSVQPSDRFLISMMMDTAEVTALAALLRGESRGSHYRTDSPKENKEWEKKIVLKLCEGKCEVRYASP